MLTTLLLLLPSFVLTASLMAWFFIVKFFLNDLPNRLLDKRIQVRIFRNGEQDRSDPELLQWVRALNSSEFERYVAYLFERNGYKTTVVGKSHDQGIDVIATKAGTIYYIQCKRLTDWKVRVEQVRDFYGAITDHLNGGKGYYVTTSSYTQEAKDFAKGKPLELLDDEDLISMIRSTKGRENYINPVIKLDN